MLQFWQVTKEEGQDMLSTMKTVCLWKGLTQNLACVLNLCCSVKKEDICESALRVKFIYFLLKYFSNIVASFFSPSDMWLVQSQKDTTTGLALHMTIKLIRGVHQMVALSPTQPNPNIGAWAIMTLLLHGMCFENLDFIIHLCKKTWLPVNIVQKVKRKIGTHIQFFFLLGIVNHYLTTFVTSNILQKRLNSTALSGKFSQWKKSATAISKRDLLGFQISIVFPFSMLTSVDICKPPWPEDTDKSIGVGLFCFLQELASTAAAASVDQSEQSSTCPSLVFPLLPFIVLAMKILVLFIPLFLNNTSTCT